MCIHVYLIVHILYFMYHIVHNARCLPSKAFGIFRQHRSLWKTATLPEVPSTRLPHICSSLRSLWSPSKASAKLPARPRSKVYMKKKRLTQFTVPPTGLVENGSFQKVMATSTSTWKLEKNQNRLPHPIRFRNPPVSTPPTGHLLKPRSPRWYPSARYRKASKESSVEVTDGKGFHRVRMDFNRSK